MKFLSYEKQFFFEIMTYFFFLFNTKQKSYDANMQCSANRSSQKHR